MGCGLRGGRSQSARCCSHHQPQANAAETHCCSLLTRRYSASARGTRFKQSPALVVATMGTSKHAHKALEQPCMFLQARSRRHKLKLPAPTGAVVARGGLQSTVRLGAHLLQECSQGGAGGVDRQPQLRGATDCAGRRGPLRGCGVHQAGRAHVLEHDRILRRAARAQLWEAAGRVRNYAWCNSRSRALAYNMITNTPMLFGVTTDLHWMY